MPLDQEGATMARLLMIVARDRPELLELLRQRFATAESEDVIEIFMDRRQVHGDRVSSRVRPTDIDVTRAATGASVKIFARWAVPSSACRDRFLKGNAMACPSSAPWRGTHTRSSIAKVRCPARVAGPLIPRRRVPPPSTPVAVSLLPGCARLRRQALRGGQAGSLGHDHSQAI